MTVPELCGALAILCLLVGFAGYIVSDLSRRCREGVDEWRLTQARPFDRERDAA